MTAGFIIRNIAGTITYSSDDLGLLFVDQFIVSASTTVTKTYPGLASSEVKVISLGSNSIGSNPTITVSTSGGDVVVVITTSREGWFIVTQE